MFASDRGRGFRTNYRKQQRADAVARRRAQVLAAAVVCALSAAALLSWLFRGSAGGLADAPSSSKRRPRFCEQPPPLICAHGGRISGGALANTLPAYRRALQHPAVDCVEVDVSRTRDDALVALHQRQLLSIADGEFDSVGDARLDQLRWFGADNEATRVLTVEEALSALRGRGLKTIILDIKDGPPFGTEDFAAKSLAVIAAAQCAECIVWAKEDEVVRDLVRLGRGSQAGFVLMNETADARARGMHKLGRLTGAGIVAAHWAMVDAPLVAAAHARGLRLFGWTANAVEMIDPLVTAGVAAIVTDQPTLVAQRVAALRAPCGT